MHSPDFEKALCQPLAHPITAKKKCPATVLRLDLLHPVVSGNKWFKLRFYLADAIRQNKKRVITFGGAWSNHLLATAAACQSVGLRSAAIVRGERPAALSAALQQASSLGMQLHFISRQDYEQKKVPPSLLTPSDYLINEGGAGKPGVQGAATILDTIEKKDITHILCAAGTGTTMAGLVNAAPFNCRVIGIPVLHDLRSIKQTLHQYSGDNKNQWQVVTGYEWGGYAKHTPALLHFMNTFYLQTSIPTDIVYTSKLFYACLHLVENDFFEKDSRLLIVHSGGLQGNRSLPPDTFCFS